jgi:hypothetical protein
MGGEYHCYGNTELVEFYLKNNASLDATTDNGLTVRDETQSMIHEYEELMKEMTAEDIEEYLGFMRGSFTSWYYILGVIDEEKQRREDLRLEEIRQTTCLTVMMGHHHRLGCDSWFNMIDSDITRLVLQLM